MNILYVTTVGSTMNFFTSHIKMLLDKGHRVDIATNEKNSKVPECYHKWGCSVFQIETSRSPMSDENRKAFRELKQLVTEGKFDVIHCHTPVASVLTRLAARKARKQGTKVIYTAHGFHFYKGAPLVNWLLYYPTERFCAHFTDALITINHEDYERAKGFAAKKVYYVPGMGVDCEKIAEETEKPSDLRKQYEIPENAFAVLSVGEVNQNKNHRVVLEAIHRLSDENIYYIVCGRGDQKEPLESLAKEYGMQDRLKLVGYQTNIAEWLSVSDVFAFPSVREGLGLAALEAMAAGLPLVTSDSGGIKDYMQNGKTGFCCRYDDTNGFAEAIKKLKEDSALREKIGEENKLAVQKFDVENVKKIMKEIYEEVLQ